MQIILSMIAENITRNHQKKALHFYRAFQRIYLEIILESRTSKVVGTRFVANDTSIINQGNF